MWPRFIHGCGSLGLPEEKGLRNRDHDGHSLRSRRHPARTHSSPCKSRSRSNFSLWLEKRFFFSPLPLGEGSNQPRTKDSPVPTKARVRAKKRRMAEREPQHSLPATMILWKKKERKKGICRVESDVVIRADPSPGRKSIENEVFIEPESPGPDSRFRNTAPFHHVRIKFIA